MGQSFLFRVTKIVPTLSAEAAIINQSIIVKTSKAKSLLPSLYQREEFPSLERRLMEVLEGECLVKYKILIKLITENEIPAASGGNRKYISRGGIYNGSEASGGKRC